MKAQKNKILAAFNKISSSDAFIQSDLYIFILRFLVNSYLSGDRIKETIIEYELEKNFAEKQSFKGNVRVYMFKLRKKLDTYYEKEGVDDKIIFEIKKGQYNLSIKKESQKNAHLAKLRKSKALKWYVFVMIAAIPYLIWLLAQYSEKPSYCWTSFFNNDQNITCYIGDHFVTRTLYDSRLESSLYIAGITSLKKYNHAVSLGTIDSLNVKPQDYTFVTKMGPICAGKLSGWFSSHDKPLEVVMESDFMPDHLLNNNIIYIGPTKTLSNLKFLLLSNSKKYNYQNQHWVDIEENKHFASKSEDKIWHEYVMVSYNHFNENKNKILFITSDHDIGVMAMVSNFIDEKWLADFYKKITNNDSYFNALFLVKGIDRTNIESQLVSIELLE